MFTVLTTVPRPGHLQPWAHLTLIDSGTVPGDLLEAHTLGLRTAGQRSANDEAPNHDCLYKLATVFHGPGLP